MIFSHLIRLLYTKQKLQLRAFVCCKEPDFFHFQDILIIFAEECILRHYTKYYQMNNRNHDLAYFISFCIEQYKKEKGISGSEAMALLSEYGVLEYLSEHWEILHTQSRQWIIEDIDEFIRTRKGE